MTTAPTQAAEVSLTRSEDHRGSPIPNVAMIATRLKELRKRRGLMITLTVVYIGIPTIVLAVRLLSHAIAPKSHGPAGGYDIFTQLVTGLMYVLGFIVAATLGCTAGSDDLAEGMFRHLVVTGRSRLALYLARIPAGLGIVAPVVAVGFTIVCTVCALAAPTKLSYQGVNLPVGLSRTGYESWAADHPDVVICNFPYNGSVIVVVSCGPNGPTGGAITKGSSGSPVPATPAMVRAQAIEIAEQDFSSYAATFLSPPDSLIVEAGLWLELEAVIGFMVGLGLASLMGQRTVPVILLIVLEVILTPILSTISIPHLINLQRAVVGVAMAHLKPAGLSGGGGGPFGGGGLLLVPETRTVAVCVIIAWLAGWTFLGAWRMMTRDA
jgi:hypothetical protein